MGIKYKVNEDFFKKWTQEMAYTLGYLYADGSLEDASYIRGKYVRVSSVERENIVKIRKWLGSEHTIVPKAPTTKNGRIGYLLRIGNHILYDDLTRLGLYPNKSLTIIFPAVPKKYLGHFVRGYFDGDGCVRLSTEKGILKKLSTVFTSGSKIFLHGLALRIHETTNTSQLNIYDSHKSFVLSYSSSDSIKIFKLMYGRVKGPVYVERKFDTYRKYLELKPKRVDKKVKSILQCLG
ncbi:MAG: hypothetical protein KBD19_04365 [Candidatus Moranbacteria bacterium]|nr:hypothetical protein [Candidatus Moranbacteria bacterium]